MHLAPPVVARSHKRRSNLLQRQLSRILMECIKFKDRSLLIADPIADATLQLAMRAAKSELPVIVVGESGTGKELIARLIHEKGVRQNGPFVSVNCAAIPEGLLEAELFGYEKGAFTGAIQRRVGKFQLANGGTLLLDEVSELPIHLQAKLLRVLQEKEIDPIGSQRCQKIDVRIVVTSNRDLVELIEAGEFREDLFYRLNGIRIECKPLRNRQSALIALTQFYLNHIQERTGFVYTLAESAMNHLLKHTWPGNVRELSSVIERAVVLCEGTEIQLEQIQITNPNRRQEVNQIRSGENLEHLERRHILETLSSFSGNRTRAAEKLGISVRTLRNKLKLYSE